MSAPFVFKNPLTLFSIVPHNNVKLPRAVHLLAHVALGVAGAAIMLGERALTRHLAHDDVTLWRVYALALAIIFEFCAKHTWWDWQRVSGKLFHWLDRFDEDSVYDAVSDFSLAILGALSVPPIIAWYWLVAIFIVLSTFNET